VQREKHLQGDRRVQGRTPAVSQRRPADCRELRRDPKTGSRVVCWTFIPAQTRGEAPVEPTLTFGPWCAWNARQRLKFPEDAKKAGIYMFAYFPTAPEADTGPSVEDLPAEIVYVGMSKNLNNRPLLGHHTAITRYRRQHREDPQMANLYVSVCPVYQIGTPDKHLWYALLQYLEMKVQWKYTQQHRGRLILAGRKKKIGRHDAKSARVA
jgi:hypothetical protein